MLIKVDDIVEVMTGADKFTRGEKTRGKVLRVLREKNKIVVEHVNRVYKHVGKSQKNPQGGRLSLEMPIDASNVLVVCEKCGKPSRLGKRYLEDGSKERFCKKCGAGTGQIGPARAKYAKK